MYSGIVWRTQLSSNSPRTTFPLQGQMSPEGLCLRKIINSHRFLYFYSVYCTLVICKNWLPRFHTDLSLYLLVLRNKGCVPLMTYFLSFSHLLYFTAVLPYPLFHSIPGDSTSISLSLSLVVPFLFSFLSSSSSPYFPPSSSSLEPYLPVQISLPSSPTPPLGPWPWSTISRASKE